MLQAFGRNRLILVLPHEFYDKIVYSFRSDSSRHGNITIIIIVMIERKPL